jgi:hypothetical protein
MSWINLQNAHSGAQKQMAMLLVGISLLLVARQMFMAVTVSNASVRLNEAYWYPFSEIPALFSVSGFAAVGIVKAKGKKNEGSKGFGHSEVGVKLPMFKTNILILWTCLLDEWSRRISAADLVMPGPTIHLEFISSRWFL